MKPLLLPLLVASALLAPLQPAAAGVDGTATSDFVWQNRRWGPEEEFRGVYNMGFEVSAFEPGVDGRWTWVSFHGDAFAPIDAAVPRQPDRVARTASFAIRFIGRRSLEPGPFGQQGMYQRHLLVTQVVELRRTR